MKSLLVAASMSVGLIALCPVTPPSAAAPSAKCAAPLEVPLEPRTERSLAPGVLLRIWDAKYPARPGSFPVAVVEFAASRARVAPLMTKPPMPLDAPQAFASPRVIATLNGDYFDYVSETAVVPRGMVVAKGRTIFAPRGWSKVVALDTAGRSRTTALRFTGSLQANRLSWTLGAVNDPRRGRGLSVFTDQWAGAAIGLRRNEIVVIIKHGRVASISRDNKPSIGRDEYALRMPADSSRALKLGTPVRLALEVIARDGRTVHAAAGHGGRILSGGRIQKLCSEYENLQRPRSMLAWNSEGRLWLLASGTGQATNGVQAGGSTKRQLAQLARGLGADEGVILDGGGSTAMYARIGAKVKRVDAQPAMSPRVVPQLWTVVTVDNGVAAQSN